METKEKTIRKKTESVETKEKKVDSKLLAVIRIAGQVKIKPGVRNTLYRLRLRKKYVCVLINPDNAGLMGMLLNVKYHVAYGEISSETLSKLLLNRAMPDWSQKEKAEKIMKKLEKQSNEIAEELMRGKDLEEFGIKPFFRLHPPRGGIKSKLQYPKGVLCNNKSDINKLIERML
ncbi:MAG: uL30 family ribosomal protein [Nanoarchaeota archaeon]